MKKDSNQRFEDFPPANLYLDDILELIDCVESVAERIEIKIGEYILENKEEVFTFLDNYPKDRFPEIYIKSYSPYLSIELRSFNIYAYISEDTAEQQGVVAKLRRIVSQRQKKFFKLYTGIPLYMLGAILGIYLATKNLALAGIPLIIGLLCIMPVVNFQQNNSVILRTYKKDERKSFFVRNKDQILLSIFSALLGGAVTLLIVNYTK